MISALTAMDNTDKISSNQRFVNNFECFHEFFLNKFENITHDKSNGNTGM